MKYAALFLMLSACATVPKTQAKSAKAAAARDLQCAESAIELKVVSTDNGRPTASTWGQPSMSNVRASGCGKSADYTCKGDDCTTKSAAPAQPAAEPVNPGIKSEVAPVVPGPTPAPTQPAPVVAP